MLLIAGLTIVVMPACSEKEGCMDPACSNYDSEAEVNVGCECGESDSRTLTGSTGTRTLLADGTPYVLNGFVHVDEGDVLTIQAGAVIKGMNGSGADASALIVARGGKIMAEGTVDNPIIFTSVNDDLNGSLDETISGEWGGVIILGNAGLNTSNTEQSVEGIPTTEAYAKYGGSNDADNSGVFKYVSIRHGGTNIGEGNEINGLTLGGVGSGTVIEHVEVYANADDGIEFFGGTANVKWAVTAYCGDDSYDYDQGWRGKGQFWVSVNGGDRGGEHDGGTDPEDGTPYAKPTIYNATYVGIGIEAGKRAITFRDNAGGFYNNSIFVGYGKGIDIEDLTAENGSDSWERFEMGDLALSGNIFWNTQQADGAATAADLFVVNAPDGFDTPADSTSRIAALVASFAANGNSVENPGISAEGTIDLMPEGTVVSGATTASDSWFTAATYAGAIDPSTTNWLNGWTKVSAKF
mgnify:CR=1 FL=1